MKIFPLKSNDLCDRTGHRCGTLDLLPVDRKQYLLPTNTYVIKSNQLATVFGHIL